MFPVPTTSFCGRVDELAALERLLQRSDVRLITICGPGGIGKSRLALAAAAQIGATVADTVIMVPLLAVNTLDQAMIALAQALGLPLTSSADPLAQVVHALQAKRYLLVLDTLEHLATIGDLLSQLVQAVPTLKLLVTSRVALEQPAEWLFPLEGLPLGDGEQPGDAIRLFLERAAQAGYTAPTIADHAAIMQICTLVGGMPLAIELAAAWTRTLACTAIAAALADDLDLLSSRRRNLPDRHRSMRAVCDQSWALLDATEQRAFRRLALFRAGFTTTAAQAVAGVDLATLDALISHSLLRRTSAERYQFHDVLRQYGVERLHADPVEAATVQAALGRYYGTWLNDCFAQVGMQGISVAALADIAPELPNLHACWADLLAAHDGESLRRAANLMQNFYFTRGPYRDGAALITQTLEHLRSLPLTAERAIAIADSLNGLGWFHVRQGQIATAQQFFTEALDYAPEQPRPISDVTEPLVGLGVVALVQGEYRDAVRLGLAALARAEAEGHLSNQAFGLYVLVGAAHAQGQYAIAQRYVRQMTTLVEQIGNQWFLAYCQIEAGHIAQGLGDLPLARRHYQAAFTLRESFGDPQGMAVALAAEGTVALRLGELATAQQRYERSLAIYRQLGDQGGLAEALHGYGRVQLALTQPTAARDTLHEALQIADTLAALPLQCAILVSIAELLIAHATSDAGIALLYAVVRHPATDRTTNERAHQLLMHHPHHPDASADAPTQLAQQIQALLRDLPTLGLHAGHLPDPSPPTSIDLVEQLTEREHTILQQIAAGQSNQSIAAALICSVGTVKWYTTQIYGKLGVKSRTQAVARARELGIIP
jgi:predicted ATPase/DNA-binding NarL/FixJ family response regulator/Tfp pilus assembly protein PilF